MANRSRCCSPPEHLPTRRSAISAMPARRSAAGTSAFWANRLAVYWAVSPTVRSLSSPPVCMTAETRPRRMACCGVMPSTETSPPLGVDRPRIMSMVEVLPAPFGPRNATTSPCSMVRST